jgi:MFS family permease
MNRRTLGLMIFALLVCDVTASFETAMIYAALKPMNEEFGDPIKVGWLVTSYLLIAAAATAVVGRIGDLFGRKRVLIAMLAVGAIGSLISAFGESYAVILAGRAIQGLTGAVLSLAFGIVREEVRSERVPLATGIMLMGATIGTATGLVAGGLIVDNYGWHAIFYASAALALASIVLALVFVPARSGSTAARNVDYFDGLIFIPAVTGLLLYMSNIKLSGWTGSYQLPLAAFSITCLVVWIRKSMRSANPLINVRLFADRTIWVSNAITALYAVSALQITLVFSIILQSPVWTGIGLGVTATVSGLVKLPSNLSSMLAAPLAGWITGRRGGRVVMFWGGLMTATGWFMALFLNQSTTIVALVLIVISFGTTMTFATAPTMILTAAPKDRSSEATGMLSVVRSVFMAIGAQFVSVLLASDTIARGGADFPSRSAAMLTIGIIGGLSLGAAALSFALPKAQRSKAES